MRFFTLCLLLLLGASLTAQTNHAVGVTSNVFTPENLTIQVGDTVTWTNTQGVHNVNGSLATYPNNPEGFRSGNAAPPGWVFSYVFNVPGTYEYQCDPHVGLGMVGTVTVEGAAQNDNVVITEIMYNPPESGTDSLEFIEFFNPGPGNIQMEGWTVIGLEFTFPAYELPADGYVVVAVDSQAFVNNFGTSLEVFQTDEGGLNNGGETITISDANGNLIDEVTYDDEAPWPLGTDGDGASIVLCDPAEDNSIATNWQAASTEVGVEINGNMLLANPGAASDCGVAEPVVFWISEDQVINEDAGTVSFQFVAQNYPSGETIRMNFVVVNPTVDVSDISSDPVLPATYTATDAVLDTFSIDITVVDDTAEEGDEFGSLELVPDVGTVVGNAILSLTFRDNDAPLNITPIDDINNLSATGAALSDGQMVTVQGVVHCIDFRGSGGLQFYIIEEATGDGINIFSFDDNTGYTVTEGDLLQVDGEVTQFNGLLEVIPTNITVVSMDNPIQTPIDVTTLNETTESKYVRLTEVTPVENNLFERAGGGWNVPLVGTNNPTDTVNIRVEDELGVDSTFIADYLAMADQGLVITGLGSQFDNDDSDGLLGNYQLLVCGVGSFDVATSVNEPNWSNEIRLFPNPTAAELNVSVPEAVENFRLIDLHGRVLQTGLVNTIQLRLDMRTLPTGMYHLQLFGEGGFATRPVVKY